MDFLLGFFNSSSAEQDCALFLDEVSLASFTLKSNKGTTKYVTVNLSPTAKISMTI